MRSKLAVSTALAVVGSLALATPATAGPGDDRPGKGKGKGNGSSLSSKKLTQAVTVNGIMAHARALQRIADQNDGNRASGQPGYTASADYVAKTMRASGYKVTRQPFTFPSFIENTPATLTQTAPATRDIETLVMTYSGSGDVTGSVVPIDLVLPPGATPSTSGCEAADFPAASGQAVALMQRGTCPFDVKAANAKAAGYAAAVIFNEGQEGRQELLAGTLSTPIDIPVVGVSFADGQALATAGTAVRVTTSTVSDLDARTENVIVDLPKRAKARKPGQVVVVGAHLDSVAEGPGINDNGSGTATLLETAQQMAAKKLTRNLHRPVRFVFYGAEELGLLGSTHYVETLKTPQLKRIYANLNFDMLGSPNYARFVYDGDGSAGTAGPAGSGAIEKIFTRYFTTKKLASAPTAFDGRSDYGPFIAAGIPAGGLFSGAEGVKTADEARLFGGTAGVAYDACYHQACDDISNLSAKALNELGDAAVHATYVLTATKKGIYPDGSRKAAGTKRTTAPRVLAGHGTAR